MADNPHKLYLRITIDIVNLESEEVFIYHV